MAIQQTDQRLFKGTTAEIFAFAPPAFDGWTYAESTDDNSAYRWNSTTLTWEPITSALVMPTSPNLFVASTGSDAPSQPGTLALPLATAQEALRRLGATRWLVDAFVTVVDTLNEGANPVWSVPAPVGGAKAICIKTTYATVVAGVVPTGGTAGTLTTATPGTFTSANALGANTQRGQILSVTGGPVIANTRYVIDSNDGAGGFTPAALLAAAPVAANTFDILSRSGKITWSGRFTMFTPGGVYLEGLEMLPTVASSEFQKVGGWLVENATRWISAATFAVRNVSGSWFSSTVQGNVFGITSATTGVIPLPTSVSVCGCRYDGAAAIVTVSNGGPQNTVEGVASYDLSMASMQGTNVLTSSTVGTYGFVSMTGLVQLTDCGVAANNPGSALIMQTVRLTSGRKIAGTTFTAGIISVSSFARALISLCSFVTPAVADDLIGVTTLAEAGVGGVSGAAGAAGKLFINILTGGRAYSTSANTATGGTVGTDIAVDGGTGFAVALFATFSPIGASTGTFTHSTNNSGTPAIANTVNKLSGREALAATSGAVFTITNSLAAVGDDCFVQLVTRDATALAPIAVVTANTITVTFLAAATAATTFAWWLKKSTA
jgi:hypothetical protein